MSGVNCRQLSTAVNCQLSSTVNYRQLPTVVNCQLSSTVNFCQLSLTNQHILDYYYYYYYYHYLHHNHRHQTSTHILWLNILHNFHVMFQVTTKGSNNFSTKPVEQVIGCVFQYIHIQQDATLYNLFYLETALHVLGGTATHYQECKQLYLQNLVFVTPLLLSATIVEELEPVPALPR